jgi:hypothetical protein
MSFPFSISRGGRSSSPHHVLLPVSSHAARCSPVGRLDLERLNARPRSRLPARSKRRRTAAVSCSPPQPPRHPLIPHHHSHTTLSRRDNDERIPWLVAVRVRTSWACTTASGRRLARAASASSSRAPTCSTSSRSRSSSSRGRATLPSCAMSTARTRSLWAAVSASSPYPVCCPCLAVHDVCLHWACLCVHVCTSPAMRHWPAIRCLPGNRRRRCLQLRGFSDRRR